jgi:alpha-1,4-galacturonosyltransferase
MLEQQQETETSNGINMKRPETNKQNDQMPSDARVQQLKDQVIQAKVFLSLPVVKSNPPLTRELRLRMKEVSRTLGDATKDSDLPRK